MLVCALFLSACNEQLYTGLSVKDANEMVAVLQRNNIEATREAGLEGTYTLMVPKEQFSNAFDVLNANGLPKEKYRSLADVFPGAGLIVSPFEQRARLSYALNQEMAQTISSIDGVVSARVHVVIPELDMRGQAQGKTSAAVVVHHRPSVDPGDLAPKIRLIVANGIQGLNYKDVSLAFFSTKDSSGQIRTDSQKPVVMGNMPNTIMQNSIPSVEPKVATPHQTTNAQANQMPNATSQTNVTAPQSHSETSLNDIMESKVLGLPLNLFLWSAAGISLILALIMRMMRNRKAES